MRLRIIAPTVLLISMSMALPLAAQYREMARVESLSKTTSETQILNCMAKHFGIAAETLQQERSANGLSFGQLFLVHAVARATQGDAKNILIDAQSKPWPQILKERNVDMKQLSNDQDALEKAMKDLQKSK